MEHEGVISVVSLLTNGYRNPDGSKMVLGARFLTSTGLREVFVGPEDRWKIEPLEKIYRNTHLTDRPFSSKLGINN